MSLIKNGTYAQQKAEELRKRTKKPSIMIMVEKVINKYIVDNDITEITDKLENFRNALYYKHNRIYVSNDTLRNLIEDNQTLKMLNEAGVDSNEIFI